MARADEVFITGAMDRARGATIHVESPGRAEFSGGAACAGSDDAHRPAPADG